VGEDFRGITMHLVMHSVHINLGTHIDTVLILPARIEHQARCFVQARAVRLWEGEGGGGDQNVWGNPRYIYIHVGLGLTRGNTMYPYIYTGVYMVVI